MRKKLDRGGVGGREREEDVERTVIQCEEGATQLVRLCSLTSPPLVTIISNYGCTVEQSSNGRSQTEKLSRINFHVERQTVLTTGSSRSRPCLCNSDHFWSIFFFCCTPKSLNRAEELRAAAAIHRVPLNRDGQISRQPLALSLSVPAKIQAGSNTS